MTMTLARKQRTGETRTQIASEFGVLSLRQSLVQNVDRFDYDEFVLTVGG